MPTILPMPLKWSRKSRVNNTLTHLHRVIYDDVPKRFATASEIHE